jgi:hypothetical protein
MLGIARPSECPVCGWTRLHRSRTLSWLCTHPRPALTGSPEVRVGGALRSCLSRRSGWQMPDCVETHGTCQASPHFPLKGKRGVLDRWMIGGKRSVFCNLFFGLSMMRRSARAPAIASPLVDGNAGLPCHTTRESGVNALPPRPIHATLSLPATGKLKGEGREPAGYTRG